jgi:hypothetical protein
MSDKKADRVHELPPGPSVGKKPDLIRPDLPPGWVIGPRIEDFLRDDWFVEPRDG